MKIGILAEGTVLVDEAAGTRWRVDKCWIGRGGEQIGPELQLMIPMYELSQVKAKSETWPTRRGRDVPDNVEVKLAL